MASKKITRYRKGDQTKEEIARVLEQCGPEGIADAMTIRATKKFKLKYYRRRTA